MTADHDVKKQCMYSVRTKYEKWKLQTGFESSSKKNQTNMLNMPLMQTHGHNHDMHTTVYIHISGFCSHFLKHVPHQNTDIIMSHNN